MQFLKDFECVTMRVATRGEPRGGVVDPWQMRLVLGHATATTKWLHAPRGEFCPGWEIMITKYVAGEQLFGQWINRLKSNDPMDNIELCLDQLY